MTLKILTEGCFSFYSFFFFKAMGTKGIGEDKASEKFVLDQECVGQNPDSKQTQRYKIVICILTYG